MSPKMNTTRQNTKTHQCKLPGHTDNIVNTFINRGLFVQLRRQIKRFFMINVKHPRSRTYVQSIKELKEEERRHLINYYIMIHPLSMFSFWWKVIVFFSLWTEYVIWPFVVPYSSPFTLQLMFGLHNVIYAMLIPISFLSGHYNRKSNIVYLRFRFIALRYLGTYFIFDVIALGTVVLRFLLIAHPDWDLELPIIRILRWILPLFKYARYPYFKAAFKDMKLYFGFNHFVFLALDTVFILHFFLLIIHTIVFVILRELPENLNKRTLMYAISSMEMILMIDHGQHVSPHLANKLAPIIFILFGFVLHLILHVCIMQIWIQFYSTENTQTKLHNSLDAYIKYKVLPKTLKDRIFLYLDFKYQKHYYKDSSIILATSYLLRKEILVTITKDITQKVKIFQGLPEHILQQIRMHFFPSIFLTGDLLCKEGTTGRNLFFIVDGTVKITNKNDKEVYRIRDGTCFGEISLLLDVPRIGSAIAVTPCDVYVLEFKYFYKILRSYPDLHNKLMDMANSRKAKLLAGVSSQANLQQAPTESEQYLLIQEDITDFKTHLFQW